MPFIWISFGAMFAEHPGVGSTERRIVAKKWAPAPGASQLSPYGIVVIGFFTLRFHGLASRSGGQFALFSLLIRMARWLLQVCHPSRDMPGDTDGMQLNLWTR